VAIESGDVDMLAAAIDATFDQRASVMPLDPAHVEMITVARAHDAAANYTGSGGAIIVLPRDGSGAQVRAALAALPGCATLAVT
jgi:glucuronokinase